MSLNITIIELHKCNICIQIQLFGVPDTLTLNARRLTEEEESAPSGPPRTKNELLFDNSLIYDPDSNEIEDVELRCGEPIENSCMVESSTRQRTTANSVALDDLNQIGTIMYDTAFRCWSGAASALCCCSLIPSQIHFNVYPSRVRDVKCLRNLLRISFDRCRMDEENTIVVQAMYTQSPLNEG